MGVIDKDLYLAVRAAAARGLNLALYDLYLKSQREVPKGEGAVLEASIARYGESLGQSGRYGGPVGAKPGRTSFLTTDIHLGASVENLEGSVVYESPYAMAQHEGEMDYIRNDKEVRWKVEHYTRAGTKKHYLSDPAKELIPKIPAIVGVEVEKVLAEFSIEGDVMGRVMASLSLKL